jgi:N-methylhydantoinase A
MTGTSRSAGAPLGALRIAVDVGGTFTDLVVADQDGHLRAFKAASTPSDQSRGVFDALDRAAAAFGLARPALLGACTMFVHGTTVATNTMVQRAGARLGMLTTTGFRDILAIRRGRRAYMWDYRSPYPPELVPRYLRLPVRERIDGRGGVVTRLSEDDVRAACRTLREHGVEAVIVCFLNSYLNDAHERQAEGLASAELPDTYVFRSSDVLPLMGEYERYSTTAVNAYVAPRTIRYLARLQLDLIDAGLRSAMLVMESTGGIIDLAACERKPVLTVLSGPAAAAPAAQLFGDCLEERNIVLFDMGGTSCDVILVKDGVPAHTEELQVAGYDIALPAVDVVTIGAGGGTIAWVDAGGLLRAGPHSAGADPGPVCYGKGGAEPTATDANLVLGRLDPDNFLGGEIRLDVTLARQAIEERLARPLGLSAEQAALAVLRIINQNMIEAIKMLSLERGHDPRKFVLVAAGGAGGLHAGALARELGIRAVYLARQAAVCCTVGMLHSDIRHDYFRSHFARLSPEALTAAAHLLEEMRQTAQAKLESEGFAAAAIEYRPAIGLRYVGQQWQIPIDVVWPLAPGFLPTLVERFHVRHEELYGSRDIASGIDLVDVRLTAIGPTTKVKLTQDVPRGGEGPRAATATRRVWFDGRDAPVPAGIFPGVSLLSGDLVVGPAVIEESATTLVVAPGEEVRVDRYGNYRLTRARGAQEDLHGAR